MKTLCEIAEWPLSFHRQGLRLIPMHGKTPLIKAWPSLCLSEQDIREWNERGVNWAAITGDPLIVVDTDSDLAEAKVRELRIESSVEVVSGRGGKHRYFRSPDGGAIRCKNGVLGIKGIDLKGIHGLIVLPGSIHPETGRRYEYVPGKELRTLHEMPVFDLGWLPREVCASPVSLPTVRSEGRVKIRDIFAYLLTVESVQGDYGSTGCFRACCTLRGEGYSPREAWPILLWWNERVPRPKWSSRELIHKLESAYLTPLRDLLE